MRWRLRIYSILSRTRIGLEACTPLSVHIQTGNSIIIHPSWTHSLLKFIQIGTCQRPGFPRYRPLTISAGVRRKIVYLLGWICVTRRVCIAMFKVFNCTKAMTICPVPTQSGNWQEEVVHIWVWSQPSEIIATWQHISQSLYYSCSVLICTLKWRFSIGFVAFDVESLSVS